MKGGDSFFGTPRKARYHNYAALVGLDAFDTRTLHPEGDSHMKGAGTLG